MRLSPELGAFCSVMFLFPNRLEHLAKPQVHKCPNVSRQALVMPLRVLWDPQVMMSGQL